jgi:hypothetical protein
MAWFNIIGKLTLDTASFDAGVKKAESASAGMAKSIGGQLKGAIAGAFTVGAITQFTRSVINAGDRIGDLAEQFQITNEEVQKLEILANRTGVPLEKMGNALIKLAEIRSKASGGDNDAIRLLGSFGVSQSEAANSAVSNLQLLTKISEEYAKQAGSFDSQARAADLIGTKMESVLRAMRGINDLGPVKIMSDEDIKALSDASDAIDEIIRQSKVAAAPTIGFWGRVIARGNKSRGVGVLKYLDAIGDEMFDEGPTSSEALPVPQTDSPFFTDFGGAEDWRAGRDRLRADRKSRMQIEKLQFGSSSQLGVNQMGGYFFGSDDTAKQDLAEMRKSLEKISMSIEAVKNQ